MLSVTCCACLTYNGALLAAYKRLGSNIACDTDNCGTNVFTEFEYILENFPEVKAVGIEDDTFTADIDRTKTICKLLIEKGRFYNLLSD